MSMKSELPFSLSEYLCFQLTNLFPSGKNDNKAIPLVIDLALERTELSLNAIKGCVGGFNQLISWHYSLFLYHMSRYLWRELGEQETATRIFLLNKALNGIDLFYEVEMPQNFLICHTVGAVFAKAQYGNYSVFYQGCTVGRQADHRPVLEDGVVMFPGSMVLGKSLIRENTVISANVTIINSETPGNCMVFQGKNGKLFLKELDCYYADKYFERKSSLEDQC